MPNWVTRGYQEYAKRLPRDYQLNLIEIEAQKRVKSADINKIIATESQQLFAAIPKDNHIIALDRHGISIDTRMLAQNLQNWHDQRQNISLLIGGPEGITSDYLDKSNQIWSLSALTLPHPLVRIIIAEQIYRAWSILQGHPYHRC